MHSSEVTGTPIYTIFRVFPPAPFTLARSPYVAHEHARLRAASWRRLSPTPTLGAKTKSRRSDRICNLKERTRSTHPEHQAGKASTRLERRAPCWKGQHNNALGLSPAETAPWFPTSVRSSSYCCALLLRAATVARVDAHVLRNVALLDEILGPAFRHHLMREVISGHQWSSVVISGHHVLGPRFVITEYTSPLGS